MLEFIMAVGALAAGIYVCMWSEVFGVLLVAHIVRAFDWLCRRF